MNQSVTEEFVEQPLALPRSAKKGLKKFGFGTYHWTSGVSRAHGRGVVVFTQSPTEETKAKGRATRPAGQGLAFSSTG